MYKNKKILALIPARSGSKGLPGKNIKPLLGKPLISWTIEQVKNSKYVDKIVVSTDDKAIAKIAKKYGAEVPFLRPKELASDKSRVINTVIHALDFFKTKNLKFDYLALFETTSPLRKDDDIDVAIKKLIDNEDVAESVVSVGEITSEHPLYSKKISKDGYIIPYFPLQEDTTSLRQELSVQAYFPYGVIYISKVSAIRKHKAVYPNRILPFYIERWQNYEIDDIWDFICIEAILNYKNKKINQ